MFEKGTYLKKNDGHRISKSNKYPVLLVHSCVELTGNPGFITINGTLKAKAEWYTVITEDEYNAIRKQVDESRPAPMPKKEKLEIQPGQFFRKKNWEFMRNPDKNTYAIYPSLPAVKVITAKRHAAPHMITLNKHHFNLKDVVVLTEQEYNQIIGEWGNQSISPVLLGRLETVHYREDTGEQKKQWTQLEALKHVFIYNKKNPGKHMNAYQCPYCNHVHCGKMPTETTEPVNKYNFKTKDWNGCTHEEKKVLLLSKGLMTTIKLYWPKTFEKMNWETLYNKNSRINVGEYDIVATQRHFTGGWYQIFEIVPIGMDRYDNGVGHKNWAKEFKGMRTAYEPPGEVVLKVTEFIKRQSSPMTRLRIWFEKKMKTWKSKKTK